MMESVYEKLKKAQSNQAIIDIYQKNSDIVYTGRVKFVTTEDFIMQTYNDFGVDDGAVFLKNANVALVDFDSYDVEEMMKKISFARLNNLYGYNFHPNQRFDETDESLYNQLFDYLRDNFLLSMIITKKGEKYTYTEGMLMENNENQMVLQAVNKFDFVKQSLMPIDLDDLVGIEFGGNELSRLGKVIKTLSFKNHVDTVVFTDQADIKRQILAAQDTENILIFNFKDERKYFYVGQVLAANEVEFVIKVISMNGTFGGYVWMRYDVVSKVTNNSDYLRVIKEFVELNNTEDLFEIDMLNAQRDFDSQDNLLLHIIQQAINEHELLKFKTLDNQEIVGYPGRLDESTWELVIELFDYDELNETPARVVGIESICEISFEYLRLAYLEKNL